MNIHEVGTFSGFSCFLSYFSISKHIYKYYVNFGVNTEQIVQNQRKHWGNSLNLRIFFFYLFAAHLLVKVKCLNNICLVYPSQFRCDHDCWTLWGKNNNKRQKTVVFNIDWHSFSTYQRAVDVHKNTVLLIVFVKTEYRIDKDSIKQMKRHPSL